MQLSDVSFADRKMILINHPRKPEVMKMDKKYFNVSLLQNFIFYSVISIAIPIDI